MKATKKIMFTLVALALVILSAFAISAQSSPQLPHLFYGTSKVEGTNTPSGTVIIAKVSGTEKGRITTDEVGKYGGKSGNQEKLVVQGGIEEDATIEFYVSRVKADKTASFKSGKIQELNLTWVFPDVIELPSGNIANEPILCMPGTDIIITNSGLTVKIECDTASAATIKNISNLGTGFFVGAPAPGGLEELSSVFEISITGDVEIIVTMSYDDTGIDEATVRPYKFVGGVWVAVPDADIISRDTAANKITFKVSPGGTPYTVFGSVPAPAPTVVGGGPTGGGSGGGGCSYDWQCTSWSACQPNGKQTRTCTNKGTCADNLGKPSEVQDCTYTAPAPTGEETPTAPSAPTTDEGAPTAPPAPTGFAALTGAVISALKTPGGILIALIVLILVGAAGYGGYYYLYRRKKDDIFK